MAGLGGCGGRPQEFRWKLVRYNHTRDAVVVRNVLKIAKPKFGNGRRCKPRTGQTNNVSTESYIGRWMSLEARYRQVQERIARAAEGAKRDPASITLLAVTKKFPPDVLCAAYDLGMREFGENYVQEFEGKHPLLPKWPDARFHLIGHLQSNKARKAASLFQTIQTVDSARLAKRLDEAGEKLDVMIEVKLSEDEESKHGAAPAELGAIVSAIRECGNLKLLGLMSIPPWSTDPELPRPYFQQLRALAAEHGLTQLSMGMSNDLETAIEEGSTIVRVGTALFGPRMKPLA